MRLGVVLFFCFMAGGCPGGGGGATDPAGGNVLEKPGTTPEPGSPSDPATPAGSALAVPIEVRELLPEGISGKDRREEVATFGVPLADSSGVKSVSGLHLSGATESQFRALHRYPSGNIQWLLIDTLVSVPAGGHKELVLSGNGTAPFSAMLAEDKGDTIVVDTGAARFVIRKGHYNVFDSVFSRGISFLENTGGIIAESNNVLYSSANDADATAVVEENGPVKAVIRCDGHLKPEDGPWLFGYTMRMFFYKNTSRTRLDLIVRNAEISSYSAKEFSSVRIALPTTMKTPSYLFSAGPGRKEGLIHDTAYLYQGYSSHKYVQYLGGANLLKERLVPDLGLTAQNGNTVLHAPGSDETCSKGYAAMYDPESRIHCGIRNLHGMWPAGFTMEGDGDLFIDIYSPHNTKKDIVFSFFGHDKRQVVLEFLGTTGDPEETFYGLQYPLAGRTPFSHYRKTKAVYNEDRLASHEETRAFLREIGLEGFEISNQDTIRRYYVWGQGGGDNQYDLQLCKYLHYLQTGNGGAFLAAQNDDHHKMFGSVRYSDDFNFYERGPSLFKNVNLTDPPGQETVAFNRKFLDREHSHDVSVPMGYFLTGDPSLMEAWREYGEYTLYDQGSGKMGVNSYYDGTTYVGYPRVFSRALRRVGAFGQYAPTPVWQEKTQRMIRNFMTLRAITEDSDEDGWDLDRGFFYMSRNGNSEPGIRSNKVFMTYDIMANCFWYFTPDLFADPLMYEDYQDYMLGLGYHCLQEIIPLKHQPYLFQLDAPNPPDNSGEYPFTLLMAQAYEKTGNTAFLDAYFPHCKGMFTIQSKERVYSPYASKFIYNYYNRDIVTGYISPVGNGRVDMGNATSAGVGRTGSVYTLTWTVPEGGIKGYQVKFSREPMVENLNFNQETRAYEYHPDTYDNFWAALNTAGEPEPAVSIGAEQIVSVDVARAITDYNRRYDLHPGDPAYQEYDPQSDYYFAIKYEKKVP